MRIPNTLTDDLSTRLNALYNSISQRYLEAVNRQITVHKVTVMLADTNVSQVGTFEPENIATFYQKFAGLPNWIFGKIEKTETDDLRRIHVSFTSKVEKYLLTCYCAVQYHALPYYRFDKRIKEIQIEIMQLDEKTSELKREMSSKQDALLEAELKKRGIANLNFEEMLETMYNDKQLYGELIHEIDAVEKGNSEYSRMTARKDKLIAELRSMIVELYRTSPVLINHNNLMQGEEGVAIYFDLEEVNRGERSGAVDLKRIGDRDSSELIARIQELDSLLHRLS